MSRQQLLALGLRSGAIERRLANGRLHPLMQGVYAVGRPAVTVRGRWMAAVLCCTPGANPPREPHAVLSHGTAAALWGVSTHSPAAVHVSVRSAHSRRRPGIAIHRRPSLRATDLGVHDGIPTTGVVQTLVDLAAIGAGATRLERAVNEADRLDLIDPGALRGALEDHRGRRGVARLRELLDRRTFRLTASELERRFLRLASEAGLPPPQTGQVVDGFEVDFHWPDLGLVVETDGLRYHRTPAQQTRDRLRDQAHASAGLTPLRFTHAQVTLESARVKEVLTRVAARLDG